MGKQLRITTATLDQDLTIWGDRQKYRQPLMAMLSGRLFFTATTVIAFYMHRI